MPLPKVVPRLGTCPEGTVPHRIVARDVEHAQVRHRTEVAAEAKKVALSQALVSHAMIPIGDRAESDLGEVFEDSGGVHGCQEVCVVGLVELDRVRGEEAGLHGGSAPEGEDLGAEVAGGLGEVFQRDGKDGGDAVLGACPGWPCSEWCGTETLVHCGRFQEGGKDLVEYLDREGLQGWKM